MMKVNQKQHLQKMGISDDGREYTFHLRPDLKWSNGEPLTAHDFEYAWKRVLDPESMRTMHICYMY